MASNRLLDALTQVDHRDVERLFGDEPALDPPDPSVELAPVKRVAIIAEAFLPKVDGVSKTAFLTLQYLHQTGREVLVFAPDTAPDHVGSAQVIPMPSLGTPLAPETRIALPTTLVGNYLDEFAPDLIHMFSPAFLSLSAMLSGRRRNIPIIANYQTDLPGYANHYGLHFLSQPARDILRYLHNGCHLTLVPTHSVWRELRGWGYHRLRHWGRGVNLERFNPNRRSAEWRARLLNGRDPNSLLCIYVGRLANEKRVDLLLETARTPGIALTIVGDGALREELEGRFAGTGTHFMGYLFGDDLGRAYASADVFIFPSPSETFGQVAMEAQASGLPAVVINQGGVADLVTEGVTGFHVGDDPRAFAEAAIRLRDDPDLRQRMAREARRYAEQHPWEAIMAQLEGYYGEAVRLNERYQRRYQATSLTLPDLLKPGRWIGLNDS
jgi:glycosyltransferase involved in cell wall biosynthesis